MFCLWWGSFSVFSSCVETPHCTCDHQCPEVCSQWRQWHDLFTSCWFFTSLHRFIGSVVDPGHGCRCGFVHVTCFSLWSLSTFLNRERFDHFPKTRHTVTVGSGRFLICSKSTECGGGRQWAWWLQHKLYLQAGIKGLGGLGGGRPKHTPCGRQQEEDLKLNVGQ